MVIRPSAEATELALIRLMRGCPDGEAFRGEAIGLLRRAVGFDGWCWARHPLVVACGERWARSTITGFMQKAMAEVIKPAHDVSFPTSEDIEIAAAANDHAHNRQAEALGVGRAPHSDTSPAPDHKSTRNDIRIILMPPNEYLAGGATGEATSAIDDADDTSPPLTAT